MEASLKAEATSSALRKAVRAGKLPARGLEAQLEAAVSSGMITAEEAESVRVAETLREDAIQVDSFTLEDYKKTAFIRESVASM